MTVLHTADQQWTAWSTEARDTSAVYPTGYEAWDALLKRGGMRRGQLYGLLGRANVGKTCLALNLVSRLIASGAPVLFSSQEMTTADVVNRLLAIRYGLPVQAIEDTYRAGRLAPDYQQSYRQDFRDLVIYTKRSPTHEDLALQVRQYATATGKQPGVLVQDHAGLLNTDKFYGKESTKVSRTAEKLKDLAAESNLAVITLVQVGRSTDSDALMKNHGQARLTMEDAMWGGEQHYDVMWGVYRPELTPDADDPNLMDGDMRQRERWEKAVELRAKYKDQAFLSTVKNRFGPVDKQGNVVHLDWTTMRWLPPGEVATHHFAA